jgi:hypothetical protein
MILLPFGLLLLTGIFTAEPLMRVLIGLADAALICLVIKSFYRKTNWTALMDVLIFFVLLLPLLKIFTSFSFDWFNYFLFLFPVGCFIVFFPLSIYLSQLKYVRGNGNAEHKLDF